MNSLRATAERALSLQQSGGTGLVNSERSEFPIRGCVARAGW